MAATLWLKAQWAKAYLLFSVESLHLILLLLLNQVIPISFLLHKA